MRQHSYDVVVVGGGATGIVAAMASAGRLIAQGAELGQGIGRRSFVAEANGEYGR